jgi:hypothetical protein
MSGAIHPLPQYAINLYLNGNNMEKNNLVLNLVPLPISPTSWEKFYEFKGGNDFLVHRRDQ